MFQMISYKEAKQMMDGQKDSLILDVRTEDEYERGHIPQAVLLPLDTIEEDASSELPKKDQTILVYCRSGVRSKIAARILDAMGYTNVYEFGGILEWPYEITR